MTVSLVLHSLTAPLGIRLVRGTGWRYRSVARPGRVSSGVMRSHWLRSYCRDPPSPATLAVAPARRPTSSATSINVTVRPTYNFPNAQVALDYGYRLCGRIEERVSYTDMAGSDQARLQHQ